MCCFSQPVRSVSDTSIFCRMGAKGNQVVIYSMTLEADEDLAMILPIPVAAERDERSVTFVDLSNYKSFFPMLDRAFPADSFGPFGADPEGVTGSAAAARPRLEVKSVGSFDATFVPAVDDFDRLDPRFRIDREVWNGLPGFADHGFVVFKLRKGRSRLHPMAFAFPSRDRARIVFPTVHIHDGAVHPVAEFDHSLYCQSDSANVKMNWSESVAPLGRFINAPATKGTVRGNEHVYKLRLLGERANEDIVVSASV